MPDLAFAVESAAPLLHAAAPILAFQVRITNAGDEQIRGISLRCQIQIEAARRRYEPRDHERLLDLFGEPTRWSETLRSMLWTHTTTGVPPFQGSHVVALHVPCTYDFNVASAKYFYALESGDVALEFLFSGTVFFEGDAGMQIAQIPWSAEARFRLPIGVWKELMERYYPNSAWLYLRRDVFDRLYRFKMERGIPTWEQVVDRLLPAAEETARP